MKGEKGTCSAGKIPNVLRRTTFDTKENCTIAMENMKEIGVMPMNYVVYQCTECGMWHFGKPDWAKMYGK